MKIWNRRQAASAIRRAPKIAYAGASIVLVSPAFTWWVPPSVSYLASWTGIAFGILLMTYAVISSRSGGRFLTECMR